tara:strand:- start:8717 stop:9442 length:726 start_codon:yes stop_codon:yes gene_type:complete
MEFNLPTETIELPSKGLLYPTDSPLSSGTLEMKYMTAKEEDILTNQSYIQNGTVFDKLFKSLIVSNINYDELIVGDKNAILVAARILGYGKDYKFTFNGEEHTIDLSTLEAKEMDESTFTKGSNTFTYTLPTSNIVLEFKILTHKDEMSIKQELKGLQKINKESNSEVTTRLKHSILSVNGESDSKTIREFVDKAFLARDARAFREHVRKIQPDVDLTFFPSASDTRVDIPIGLDFFWPNY